MVIVGVIHNPGTLEANFSDPARLVIDQSTVKCVVPRTQLKNLAIIDASSCSFPGRPNFNFTSSLAVGSRLVDSFFSMSNLR